MPRRHISLSRSSSFTLATVFTLLLILSILTILYFMWLASGTNQRNEVAAIIKTDSNGLQEVHRVGGITALADILQYRLKNPDIGNIYILANKDNNIIIGNFAYMPNVPKDSDLFDIHLDANTENTGLPTQRSYDILATTAHFPDGYTLLVGRNISDVNTNSSMIGTLGWAMIMILALLAAAGYFISDRVVYRINLIADTASDIMRTSDLSRRIPVPGKWDDLSVLAIILNQLFEQVEDLMLGVRQVSDNVAHDLRTPLTRIKNKLEGLHNKAEHQQLEIADCTESLIKDADHLLATFTALLRIGNIESGKWHCELETVALHELVCDVIEFYEPLADEKHQMLHASMVNISLKADKHLLFQAIANLVDNAIKYTPEGGEIHVNLTTTENLITLCVTDSGEGVDPKDYESIFRRFYRTDKVRKKTGHGLGLSLVRAIVMLHKGTIKASHSDKGFSITATLPK